MNRLLNRRTKGELLFDALNVALMLLICFITIYPIWYTLVHSFNDGLDAQLGGIYWWPRKFSLDSYRAVFANAGIVRAFGITVARTALGTVSSVLFTAMAAYGLSKNRLVGRKYYMLMGTITMFFSGGLIPYFLLIRNIGLLNKFAVYIIPALFNFFNVIIFQAFFRELPAALEESARIDGAHDMKIFLRIILPLSLPVLATIGLFTGVYHWNDYFTGVIFINNVNLQPIQTYLYKVVAETSSNMMLANAPVGVSTRTATSQSLRLATMVVTTFPIVCVYPFLQKYFVKGMLIGSVKG
jgi:putative aldouronate transport system permease protein